MLIVEMWRNDKLILRQSYPDETRAMARVDALLTDIHMGERGAGVFRVEADHTDDSGVLYQGKCFASGAIVIKTAPAKC